VEMLRAGVVGIDQKRDVGVLFWRSVAHFDSFLRCLARRRGMATSGRAGAPSNGLRMIDAGTKRPFKHCCSHRGRVSGRDSTMRKLGLAAVAAASVAAAGCTPYPNQYGYNNNPYNNGYYGNGYGTPYYGNNSQAGNAVAGAALGAAGGAIAGAVLPGIRPGTGAVVGGILGGV